MTDQDNGIEVRLEVGDELSVRLEAYPGTGYSWRLVGEVDMLKPAGEPSFEGSGKLTMGGALQQVFNFRVEAVGEGAIQFEYRRPWEQQCPSQKNFSIHLIAANLKTT